MIINEVGIEVVGRWKGTDGAFLLVTGDDDAVLVIGQGIDGAQGAVLDDNGELLFWMTPLKCPSSREQVGLDPGQIRCGDLHRDEVVGEMAVGFDDRLPVAHEASGRVDELLPRSREGGVPSVLVDELAVELVFEFRQVGRERRSRYEEPFCGQ